MSVKFASHFDPEFLLKTESRTSMPSKAPEMSSMSSKTTKLVEGREMLKIYCGDDILCEGRSHHPIQRYLFYGCLLEIGIKWTMNENSSVMKRFPIRPRLLLLATLLFCLQLISLW
jgi:hypothetical protein